MFGPYRARCTSGSWYAVNKITRSDENLPVFTGILAILVCLGEWYGILVCESGMWHLGFLALAATWFLGGSYRKIDLLSSSR